MIDTTGNLLIVCNFMRNWYKPFLSEWVQTLMFRRLKQRKFVKIDQSDKRGVILTEFRNTFSTVYEVSKEETRLGLIWA
jgi:hypothetical protein